MDELHTLRLTWRPPCAKDFTALHRLVSDYQVVKWTGTWPFPAEQALTRRRCVPMDAVRGFFGLVFLDDALIGAMGFEQGELSYMFGRTHWGKGYATEIGRAMIARAFQITDWPGLSARVGQTNAGSARVLEKLGFQRTGTGTCNSVAQGCDLTSFEYELTRRNWLATLAPDEPPTGVTT